MIISLLGAAGITAPIIVKLKQKLTLTRVFMQTVESALEDKNVTPSELRGILRTGYAVLGESKTEEAKNQDYENI